MSLWDTLFKTNLKWVILAALLSVALWQVPGVNQILYPLRLFVTFVHESGHAVAALLTGGSVDSITVDPDASGLTWTRGGFRFFILSGGYLGSSLFGGLMLLAAFKKGSEKLFLYLLFSFFLGITLLCGRNLLAIIVGFSSSVLFLFLSRYSSSLLSLFLAFLGIQSSFYALNDIKTVFFLSAYHNSITTDAQLIAQEIGLLPPVVWATLWGLVSLAMLLFFLKIAFTMEVGKEKPI